MYKVILADDEPWSIVGLKKLIHWNDAGFEIAGTANDGLSALDMARTVIPDMIITDIRMPGLDGLELIEALRGELPETVMVLISGYSDFAYAQKGLQLGAFDYLVKQVSKGQLTETVQRAKTYLDRRADAQSAASKEDAQSETAPVRRHQAVFDAMDAEYTKPLRITDLARRFHMSSNYLSIMVKRETGMSFTDYLTAKRIRLAKHLLRETESSIQEIVEQTGYQEYSSFNRLFKKHTGQTPHQYRNKG